MDYLKDAIKNALETYNEVTFSMGARRMEVEGERGWHARFLWKVADSTGAFSKEKEECKWEGFATEEECFENFIYNYHPLPDSLLA